MAYVFISYRRHDSTTLAHVLKDALERAGFTTYLDVNMRPQIGPLDAQIEQALTDCTVFICLLEADTLESEWVQREIELAHTLKKQRMPVLHQNFVFPKGTVSEAVSTLLNMRGEKIYDQDNHFFDETIVAITAAVHGTLRIETIPVVHPIRFLIVENDENWIRFTRTALEDLTPPEMIYEARTYTDGVRLLQAELFDAVIMDVDLRSGHANKDGMALSQLLRKQPHQVPCGLLILSEVADITTVAKAYEEFRPIFLAKSMFNTELFKHKVKQAIRQERWYIAEQRDAQEAVFRFQFQGTHLGIGGMLKKPLYLETRVDFAQNDFLQRLQGLQKTYDGRAILQQDARLDALGREISQRLLTDAALRDSFRGVFSSISAQPTLAFAGGKAIQQVPFETMHIEGKIGGLSVPITRHWQLNFMKEPEAFSSKFFKTLFDKRHLLRILIIGEETSAEVSAVRDILTRQLNIIGVPHKVFMQSDLKSMLKYMQDNQPAVTMIHITYAATLNTPFSLMMQFASLVQQRANLKFVIANAPLGENLWEWVNALALSGVSGTVAYQLEVSEDFARHFASEFYHHYFRDFSVVEAVMMSRRHPSYFDFQRLSPICIEVK
jgi:CheY-like chemotaxis protein